MDVIIAAGFEFGFAVFGAFTEPVIDSRVCRGVVNVDNKLAPAFHILGICVPRSAVDRNDFVVEAAQADGRGGHRSQEEGQADEEGQDSFHGVLFQLQAVFEGIPDRIAEGDITVVEGVESDGLEFGHIDIPLPVQDAFVSADVDDFALEDTSFLIVGEHFALEGERQLPDQRRIDESGLLHMPSGAGHLVGDLVAGDHAHIVAGDQLRDGAHAHGKGPAGAEVLHGLMALGKVHGDFLIVGNPAPCGVHGRGNVVFAVCGDNKYGLWIGVRLRPEIFSCHNILYVNKQRKLTISPDLAILLLRKGFAIPGRHCRPPLQDVPGIDRLTVCLLL